MLVLKKNNNDILTRFATSVLEKKGSAFIKKKKKIMFIDLEGLSNITA